MPKKCMRKKYNYAYILYFLEKTAVATIYFSSTAMWRLFEGGYYSKYDVAATIYFSSTAMPRLFEGGYYSKYRRRGYYLFQLYHNAATIRGWLLFKVQTSRLLFEVQTSRLLFISALPQCGDYSRAVTIRGVAFIRGNTVAAWRVSYFQD